MADHRQDPRVRTLKSGTISGGVVGSMECVIRNVSKSGACLETKSPGAIPDDFKLIIKPDNVFRTCKVVWRAANRVGVRFA